MTTRTSTPAADQRAFRRADQDAPLPAALPAILLVDDEEGIRKVVSITLADMGHQVLTAPDGETALSLLAEHGQPIVITDVKMPGMDGLELLKRIKEARPDTEVIMVTGHGDMDMAVQSLQQGATDFITKPIQHVALEVALERSRERIHMRTELRRHTEGLERLVAEKSAALVEAERRLAAMQAVEGLTQAMSNLAGQMDGGPALMADMPCFVAVHDRELTVVSINDHYKKRLGDRVGHPSWELYCGRDRGDGECPVHKTFRTGQGQRSRELVTDVDGRRIPVIVHTAPIRTGDEGVGLVLEIAVDIGEINRLQEELKQSQLRYQHLFDTVPCYVTVQDMDLLYLEVNQTFRNDFEARVGDACYRAYMHRNTPCPDCPAMLTFEDGQLHEVEKVVTTKRGETRHVLLQTAPILDSNGEVEQVMELSTDITQIRELQDHLTSLGLLIGSVSHGIKGLLTALDGGIYRVNSGFTKGNQEQVQAGWAVVRQMVDRIRGMVLDILYYAKRRDLDWEHVDVAGLAEQVALVVEPKAQAQAIAFHRDFAQGMGAFEGDPGVLHSALVNLLENAVDACQADRSKKDHAITFSASQQGENVIFSVRDTGIGMDRETREKMFTLFFSSKGTRGTGLGLFVANRIVEQHGGTISVESEPGQGSLFTVTMPRRLPEAARKKTAPDEG